MSCDANAPFLGSFIVAKATAASRNLRMTDPRPIVISAAMIEAGVKALTSASWEQACFPESLAIDVYIAMEKLRNAAPSATGSHHQIHGDAIVRSLA